MKKQKYRNTYQRQLRFGLIITFGLTVLDLVLLFAKVSYPFAMLASFVTVMFAFAALVSVAELDAFIDKQTERQDKIVEHLSIPQSVYETRFGGQGEIVYISNDEWIDEWLATKAKENEPTTHAPEETTDSGENRQSIEAR